MAGEMAGSLRACTAVRAHPWNVRAGAQAHRARQTRGARPVALVAAAAAARAAAALAWEARGA